MVPPEPEIQIRMTIGAKTEIQRPVCRTSCHGQIMLRRVLWGITMQDGKCFEMVGLCLTEGCENISLALKPGQRRQGVSG